MSEEESGSQGRFNWERWSLIVSTASAGAGLLLTAVVTWFGVLTAQDQLDQTRQQADNDLRKQANLVTTWTTSGKDGKSSQLVANRSEDPVAAAFIRLPEDVTWDQKTGRNHYGYSAWRVGQIPPCTLVTITPKGRFLAGSEVFLTFVDSSGRPWVRGTSGTLKEDTSGRMRGPDTPTSFMWKTSKIDNCGSS